MSRKPQMLTISRTGLQRAIAIAPLLVGQGQARSPSPFIRLCYASLIIHILFNNIQ
jgi:hypothetical protein